MPAAQKGAGKLMDDTRRINPIEEADFDQTGYSYTLSLIAG